MKSTLVLSLAAAAAAAPGGSRLADRIAARAAGLTRGAHVPNIPYKGDFQPPEQNTTRQTDYSDNWSGAVYTSPPSGTTFNRISGYFNIPNVQKPGNANGGSYAASAWAGIDGDTYGNAIIQSGCDFTADANGGESYDCWYEWYPNPLTDFPGFVPSAGDTIYVNVVATSDSAGTCTLTNTNTGQTVTQQVNAPSSDSTLAGQNAEWIVEDFSENGGLVPFANFGEVTFSGCQAFAGGQTLGTSGATLIDIVQNNQQVTNAQIPSDSEVTVQYTGP